MFWWIVYFDGTQGTLKASSKDEAMAKAKAIHPKKQLRECNKLPYPATPYLEPIDHPAFCYSPNACKGRSSCPRSYACSE